MVFVLVAGGLYVTMSRFLGIIVDGASYVCVLGVGGDGGGDGGLKGTVLLTSDTSRSNDSSCNTEMMSFHCGAVA